MAPDLWRSLFRRATKEKPSHFRLAASLAKRARELRRASWCLLQRQGGNTMFEQTFPDARVETRKPAAVAASLVFQSIAMGGLLLI